MKFLHLSDLHIGKRVNEFSMIPEQDHILKKILLIAEDEKPDAVLIAGDVYDKSIPSTEAVELFDSFLVGLASRRIPVLIISGNHDSAERLSFGSRLISSSGIYIAPKYNGIVDPVTLRDAYGEVCFYMLPFIKPAVVKSCFPEESDAVDSYSSAVETAVRHMQIDPAKRNVLIAHQFVTGASTCESEELFVGGSENVSADIFQAFDYTALGHIHGPQNIGSEHIRYCGTPLKYSFSEIHHQKSVTVVELSDRELTVRTVPLIPANDFVEIKGSYEEITARSFYEHTSWQTDYTHIILTDEEDIPEAIGKLRAIYHNLMRLDYDNTRTRSSASVPDDADARSSSPMELFEALYESQNGRELDEQQRAYMANLIEKIWEGDV